MAVYLAADLSVQLANLLHKEVVSIRKHACTPLKISLFDVFAAIDGCDATAAAGHLRRLIDVYTYIGPRCEQIAWRAGGASSEAAPGSDQRVLMADLATVVDIVRLFPEQRAKKVREEAAKLFVRFVGGDLDPERELLQDYRANGSDYWVPNPRDDSDAADMPEATWDTMVTDQRRKRQRLHRLEQLHWPADKIHRYEEHYVCLMTGLRPNTVIFFTHAVNEHMKRSRTARIFSEVRKSGLDFMDFPIWMPEDCPHDSTGRVEVSHPVDELKIMGDIFKRVFNDPFKEMLGRGITVALGGAAQHFFKVNYQNTMSCCVHPCIWTAQQHRSGGLVDIHLVLAKAFEASGQQISLQELHDFVRKGSNFFLPGPLVENSGSLHIEAIESRRAQQAEVL